MKEQYTLFWGGPFSQWKDSNFSVDFSGEDLGHTIDLEFLKDVRNYKEDEIDISNKKSNSLRWPSVALSTIATNIHAGHFIGMAGSAYLFGIAQANFEINAVQGILIAAFLFVPFYLKEKVTTISQFLEIKLGRKVGLTYSILMILLYSFLMHLTFQTVNHMSNLTICKTFHFCIKQQFAWQCI